MGIEIVLRALGSHGLRKTGDRAWMAICPSHEDRKASLSIGRAEDGGALLKCHAGCGTGDVLAALGLKMTDLFVAHEPTDKPKIAATYDYRDEQGDLLYQVVRFQPKDFRQRRPGGPTGWTWKLDDVRRVLYRLPELMAAPADLPVFIVEGEKDADALAALGLVATTSMGGAGKWRDEYGEALKGRAVVVLPDNDDPGRNHAQSVADSVGLRAASVVIVNLPALPPKGDVSDWLKAGGTATALVALAAASGDPAPAASGFVLSSDRLVGEREDRIEAGRSLLSFGVAYLDHALTGITKRDLVLLGAKTGAGKTQLAMSIALHNLMQGKRVHYFALEAEHSEIERRMKYQLVAEKYYADPDRPYAAPDCIRAIDWENGTLDGALGKYEESANRDLSVALRGLQTFYRSEPFTADDFCGWIDRIKDETDLVVLDHLHYVDHDERDENRGYKQMVKQIRSASLHAGKPLIMVAHVRKGERRFEPLVPTVEDFHGSSDIVKIATKAIMIAPAYDLPPAGDSFLWWTYMQVAKCRTDGSLTRYAALMTYNARKNRYDDGYVLGRLTDGGKTFNELSLHETPAWARQKGEAHD